MKLKSMIAALALGVSISGIAAAAAPATSFNTYNLDVPGAPFYSLPYSFGTVKTFQNLAGNTYFEDTWNLDFDTAAQVVGLLKDMEIGSFYNISGFAVSLNNGSNWISAPGDLFTGVATLTSGINTLVVKGTVDGTYGGAYTLSFSAVPVPEAETWAMILAGLGLVALRARKQMKNTERLVG